MQQSVVTSVSDVLDPNCSVSEPPADRVQDCLATAVEYFHSQLPDIVADYLNREWGITRETIRQVQIGYVSNGNDVISYLRDEGYSPVTILQTGIATDGVLKHAFSCTPGECRHSFNGVVADVARAREAGEIDPGEINIAGLVRAAEETGSLWVRNWWSNRITFPYRDDNRQIRYVIARRTKQSDDTDAKYLKQSVTKPWVNTEAVFEPLYGSEQQMKDEQLLVTEGITDAIVANQHGFTAVTAASTRIKPEQLPDLLYHAEDAADVVIVNDNDRNDAGLEGALSTGASLALNGVTGNVGELPRPDSAQSIDVAEFLQTHSPEKLQAVLEDATPATEHPRFAELVDSDLVEAVLGEAAPVAESAPTPTAKETSTGRHDEHGPRTRSLNSKYGSKIYTLTLDDVCDIEPGYRGDNPLGHVGTSHSAYFAVFRAFPENATEPVLRAYDHKTKHGYNALTWLACASGVRNTDNPGGELSPRETWGVWRYAKERGDIPSDDPIPAQAIWHLADAHDLVPETEIPTSHDDPQLSSAVYNEVLELITSQYGLAHGRKMI